MQFNFNQTFSSQVSKDIESLLTPLLIANVKHFGYVKIFSDTTHLVLTTNVKWLDCFYNNFYQHGAYHKDLNAYQDGFQLWSQISDPVTVNVMCTEFNMAHGIALFKKHEEYCEIFSYGTTPENSSIIDWYLNNLDLLERFSIYFKVKATPLIQKAETDRLRFPHVLSANDNISPMLVGAGPALRKQILEKMPIGKFPINELNSLTPQEFKCVHYAMKGYTIKGTAKLLNLSPRTVETYLNITKAKLKAKNIPHLAAILASRFPYLIE